jgi:hypothetical protein
LAFLIGGSSKGDVIENFIVSTEVEPFLTNREYLAFSCYTMADNEHGGGNQRLPYLNQFNTHNS